MLRLLRASAGSGKTYRLTLEFIKLLLTVPDAEGSLKRRLRTMAELSEPLRHILAITFTNKATNEMKERIVSRLSSLSDPTVAKPDYLADLVKETGASEEAVRRAASVALRRLLNNYSDFQVSTIDSFFQSVLRTFTYEANLSDTYSVELDSDYVAKVGIDNTLTNVNNRDDAETRDWLMHLMEKRLSGGKKGWNIFQKSSSNGSLYGTIRANVKRMESEQYKRHKHEIDAYWSQLPSFRALYDSLETAMLQYVDPELKALQQALDAFLSAAAATGLELSLLVANSNRYEKAKSITTFGEIPFSYGNVVTAIYKAIDAGKTPYLLSGGESGRKKASPELLALNDLLVDFFMKLMAFEQKRKTGGFPEWVIYRENLIYFSLMQKVRETSAEYLIENNVIELAETNTLLGKVIGDDETPFIYERIGTRIDNYLIDEFQDTSRMQWENLVPLLRESESRAQENLIIGDAKQSIYRFRNADPSLITNEVSSEFPILPGGNALQENTNHRSKPGIVRFNNSFFYTLARTVDSFRTGQKTLNSKVMRDPRLLTSLYQNIVQPFETEDDKESMLMNEGYVEIRFPQKSSASKKAEDFDDPEEADDDSTWYSQVPEIVADLLRRGYKQKDIAVLGERKTQLYNVIGEFLKYNRAIEEQEKEAAAAGLTPPPVEKINFVSEESLRIADSEGVKRVLAALKMVARARELSAGGAEEKERPLRHVDINEIACAFNFLSISAGDDFADQDAIARRLEEFIENPNVAGNIDEFLDTLFSAALPSLVEGIIARYVHPKPGDGQAPYLAAFQDIVIDYCNTYPADPASFLSWWEQKGSSLAINSPQGADAVSVMTIHKSKGLQFRCVIIPDASINVVPKLSLNEWLWVEPSKASPLFAQLPPRIPVEAKDELLETAHRDVYVATYDSAITDKMNVAYVGFTRAIDELYIFAPLSATDMKKEGYVNGSTASLAQLMRGVCEEMMEVCAEAEVAELPYLVNASTPIEISFPDHIIFGEKLPQAATPKKSNDQRGMLLKPETRALDNYFIFHDPEKLSFVEAEDTSYNDDDPDPRSRGNLMHEILSLVGTADQLPAAARHLRVHGKLTRAQEKEYVEFLAEKLKDPQVAAWFADEVKVFNERPLMKKPKEKKDEKKGMKRPDRISVMPDGSAVVIDYKFGVEMPKHKKQVSGYVNLLRESGLFPRVTGYLWYLTESRVVPV